MKIEPENIVLVTIDCLRKDRLEVFGSKGGQTPFLDHLTKNSIVFHNCYTTSSATSPSFASYFTSKYPFEHGSRFTGDKLNREKEISFVEIINEKYNTAGFPTVENLNRYFNFDKGFNDFFDHLNYYTELRNFGLSQKYNLLNMLRKFSIKNSHSISGSEVNLKVNKWLKTKSESPILMWVHYFDLHKWIGEIAKLDTSVQKLAREEDSSHIYDSFVRATDKILNDLFDILSRRLNMKRTMVILSSDHGEMLNEHGYFTHGQTVYDPEMNIPLIIHYPDQFRKAEIKANVSTIDIAPTVLEIAGFEVPDYFTGQSLIPLIEGGKGKERLCYMEASYTDKYSVKLGNYKFTHNGTNYIIMPKKIVRGNELYDLSKDPSELNNIIDKKEKIGKNLKKLLFRLLKIEDTGVIPSKVLLDETIEELIKLGYLKK